MNGAQSDLTGIAPEVVQQSVDDLINAYGLLMDQVVERMQNDFINGMSDIWVCEEAVEFFTNVVKENLDKLIFAINDTFDSVVTQVNRKAIEWTNQMHAAYRPRSFQPYGKNSVDVSNIKKETSNGEKGIAMNRYSTVLNKLSDICTEAANAAEGAKRAFENGGFLGCKQGPALYNSLATIEGSIKSAMSAITELLQNSIKNTAERYGQLQENAAASFQIEQ